MSEPPTTERFGAVTDDGDYFEHTCDSSSYGECSACAIIECPHEDPMHLQHDGCPSCWGVEEVH